MINDNNKDLLKSMCCIALEMPDIILLNYCEKMDKNSQYVLSMFFDAFKTIEIVCYSFKTIGVSQTAMLLRQLLSQTAIVTILVNHPDLLNKYIEHYRFRLETECLHKHDQIDAIAEKFHIEANKSALIFLDYGWIPFDNLKERGEDGMIRYAGFDDILSWKKKYLDKFSHASFTTLDSIGENKDFPILNIFIRIASKLFDHLCVAFHNFTKFSYEFNGKDLFNDEFIPLYLNLSSFETENKGDDNE